MTLDPSVFVHPKALCESDHVGARTRVWAFAHIMEGAIVGEDCNVCDHAFIESGARIGNRVTIKNNVLVWDKVTIEDEVFLGPNVVFTNDKDPRVAFKKTPDEFTPTLVRRGATIGANATIVCGVTIGEHAMIGAGAVVTHHVLPNSLVLGNPGEHAGWVCDCGGRLSNTYTCVRCSRSYMSTDEGLVRRS